MTWRGAKPRTPCVLFCFGHHSYASTPGLNKRGGWGAQPPPFAITARIRPLKLLLKSSHAAPGLLYRRPVLSLLDVLNCCPNPQQKAQRVFGLLKCLPKSSTEGPASIRPLKLLPKPSAEGPASITPLKLLPKGPASIRPLKLLPKPSTEGGFFRGGFKGA